jgi:hypothetical protein
MKQCVGGNRIAWNTRSFKGAFDFEHDADAGG